MPGVTNVLHIDDRRRVGREQPAQPQHRRLRLQVELVGDLGVGADLAAVENRQRRRVAGGGDRRPEALLGVRIDVDERLAEERADAVAALDDALGGELGVGLAQCATADAERPGQLGLGRQLIAGRERAAWARYARTRVPIGGAGSNCMDASLDDRRPTSKQRCEGSRAQIPGDVGGHRPISSRPWRSDHEGRKAPPSAWRDRRRTRSGIWPLRGRGGAWPGRGDIAKAESRFRGKELPR